MQFGWFGLVADRRQLVLPALETAQRDCRPAICQSVTTSLCFQYNQPSAACELWKMVSVKNTLFPTTRLSPSGLQANVNASPRPFTSLMTAFVLTSQNFTTPSLLTEASSASLTGLKATLSIAAAWPFSSVEYFTFGRSGFQL